MRDHGKLKAFQLADSLVLSIYRITAGFPKEEMYGLSAQMRRSAVSVPSNIVEGCAKSTEAEYLRYLDIAFGSIRELRYQFHLAHRLGYIPEKDVTACGRSLLETEKVLNALIRSYRVSLQPSARSPQPSPLIP